MKSLKTRLLFSALPATLLIISGCSSNDICEDILEVQRQEQVCKDLAKRMRDTRYPQQALTARKRHEAECTELRYYRDEYDTICKGNQTPIGGKPEQ